MLEFLVLIIYLIVIVINIIYVKSYKTLRNLKYKKKIIRILNKSEVNLIFNSIEEYNEKNAFRY